MFNTFSITSYLPRPILPSYFSNSSYGPPSTCYLPQEHFLQPEDRQVMSILKELNTNPEELISLKQSALELAISKIRPDIVTALIRLEDDIETKISKNITILQDIIDNNWVEVIEELGKKFDFNKPINNDFIPVHMAMDRPLILKAFIKAGADIDLNLKTTSNPEGHTVLQSAAARGKDKLVRKFVDLGACINKMNQLFFNYTALHLATWKNHDNVVSELVNLKADLNVRAFNDFTPLHIALSPDIIKILITAGADTKLLNYDKFTPYLVCETRNPQLNCQLLERHAYSNKVLALTTLSHKWDIKGHSIIDDYEFDLEGLTRPYFAKEIAYSIQEFHTNHPDLIEETQANALISMFKRSYQNGDKYDAKIIYEDFKKNLPILIPTGSMGHVVSVVFHGEHLVIANKGSQSRRPVEIYKINPNEVTISTIEKILSFERERSLYHYFQWLNSIPLTLSAKQEEMTKFIEKMYPFEGSQTVGNCAWESYETSVYAILTLDLIKPGYAAKSKLEKATLLSKAVVGFKGWLQFTQLDALEKYLNAFAGKNGDFSETDPVILSQVFDQARSFTWELPQFAKKFEEFQSRYMWQSKNLVDFIKFYLSNKLIRV